MSAPTRLDIVEDPGLFPRHAARVLEAMRRRALLGSGRASIALAGGRTPREVYAAWAENGDDWDRVSIYFGDERCVPSDHDLSNAKMARETLLSKVGVPQEAIHDIDGGADDLDEAAADYAEKLPDTLDLIVLGMGNDGHTASLFPRSWALTEPDRKAVAVKSPVPPPWRITVTPVVIDAARQLVMIASGRGKAEAVARALVDPPDLQSCPAALARRGAWILDGEAASALPRRLLAAARIIG